MNVIISNKNSEILNKLDIEVIKRLDGEFEVEEIINIFQNFFFNKMILDITALKNYQDMNTLQKFSTAFDMNKIIFLLDQSLVTNSPEYLSKMISMGIYNFTTNLEGLVYLYSNPNSYKDVAQYHKLDNIIQEERTNTFVQNTPVVAPTPIMPTLDNNTDDDNQIENYVKISTGRKVIGIKSITPGAGATTLTYLMKKQLEKKYDVLAVELEKRDFMYFNDKTLLSINSATIGEIVNTNKDKDAIIIDLNGTPTAENFCTDIICLIEPSIIKINRLLSIKPKILQELKGKKVVLCPSTLTSKDVKDFEYESNLKVFYNLPPVDDHSKSAEIDNLLKKLGL